VKVLGIETATSICSAAVVKDGRVIAEASVEKKNVHAEKLLGLIRKVLEEAATTVDGIAGIAVSIGPGSFTGLRIGLSVAKGLAYASFKPLVAVPTLEALAYRTFSAGKVAPGGFVLAALDARRDEVYCQLSGMDSSGLTPVWDARDMTVTELIEEIGACAVTLSGDASMKILSHSGASDRMTFVGEELSRCSAGSVALLGHRLLEEGKTEDPSTLEPRYIKDFFLKTR